MAKGWIGIIILLVISVIYNVLLKYFQLSKWSGTGLYLGVISGIVSVIIIYIFFLRKTPKTKEELKNFEFKGIFNPLFGIILFTIISIIWTLAAIYRDQHIAYPIGGWLITLYYFFYWHWVRKWLGKNKK